MKAHGVGMAHVVARDLGRKYGHLSAVGHSLPPPQAAGDGRSYSCFQLTGNPGEIERLRREAKAAVREETPAPGVAAAASSSMWQLTGNPGEMEELARVAEEAVTAEEGAGDEVMATREVAPTPNSVAVHVAVPMGTSEGVSGAKPTGAVRI